MTTAIYARLSKNRDGKSESVARQLANARAYAEAKFPGEPIEEYADDGISAADESAHRPSFERLKTDITAGTVTRVVCRDQDRISRREMTWFQFQALLVAAGIPELHTYADGIVPVESDLSGIKAVISAGEARKLRKRTAEALESLAQQRRPHGGRSFGYHHRTNDQGQKVLRLAHDEAEVAREAARLLLAGWSLTSVVTKLNADGIPTVRNSTWTATNLRRIVTAPIMAGLRTYHGEVVGPIDPAYLDEPVLDHATWLSLRATLEQRGKHRSTRAPKQRPGARKYLLVGGILRCGKCEGVMRSHKRRNRRTGEMIARYTCDGMNGGCGRTAILAEPTEQIVVDKLLFHLMYRTDMEAVMSGHDQYEAERQATLGQIDALTARRNNLAGMHVRGDLSEGEWLEARSSADDQLSDLNERLAALPPAPVGDYWDAPTDESEPWWEAKTIEEKRQTLATWVSKIVTGPGTSGSHKFNPSRIHIYGRDGSEWE